MLEFGIQWNGAITHPWKQPLDFVGQCGRGGSGCGRRTMPLMNEDELNNGLGPEGAKFKRWGWCLLVLLIGAMVAAAAGLTVWKSLNHFKKSSAHHGIITQKYADALEVALQFFDVQKCE